MRSYYTMVTINAFYTLSQDGEGMEDAKEKMVESKKELEKLIDELDEKQVEQVLLFISTICPTSS